MLFKRNAIVVTVDGKDVGRVDRVVLDPQSKEVSHVVIRQGFLFTEDKVVPMDMVGTATEEQVTLREDADQLKELPKFEETHYVPLEEEDWPAGGRDYDAGYAPPVFWYPPPAGGAGLLYPYAGGQRYVRETEQNIPAGTVALKQGAKVLSAEGKQVGVVDEVLTSAHNDHITDLVLSQGMLIKEKKRVPVQWVTLVGEDEVHLAVVARTIDRLRDYEG